LPVSAPREVITVNGTEQRGEAAEGGRRVVVVLKTAGHFDMLRKVMIACDCCKSG
jgi:hypothetical protein